MLTFREPHFASASHQLMPIGFKHVGTAANTSRHQERGSNDGNAPLIHPISPVLPKGSCLRHAKTDICDTANALLSDISVTCHGPQQRANLTKTQLCFDMIQLAPAQDCWQKRTPGSSWCRSQGTERRCWVCSLPPARRMPCCTWSWRMSLPPWLWQHAYRNGATELRRLWLHLYAYFGGKSINRSNR